PGVERAVVGEDDVLGARAGDRPDLAVGQALVVGVVAGQTRVGRWRPDLRVHRRPGDGVVGHGVLLVVSGVPSGPGSVGPAVPSAWWAGSASSAGCTGRDCAISRRERACSASPSGPFTRSSSSSIRSWWP